MSEHALAHPLAALAEHAARYAAASSGPGTQRAYRSAWGAYAAWCESVDRVPLSGDPGIVALYLTHRAEGGLAVSTLRVAHAAIRAAHRIAGVRLDVEDARLVLVMKGIVRARAGRSRRRAAPAVPSVLRRLLAALPSPITPEAAAPAMAARHRAMLLIGFGAALRRSEIVALRVGDVTEVEGRGLSVLVRRGKTDQQGRGKAIAIWANHREPDFCPVAAFEGWMRFRGRASVESERPLFCAISTAGALGEAAMSDKIVARLMKQACRLAGLDAARFSGHSLRRGLLTAAGDLQLPLFDVMRQSRHVSVETAMTYMEAGDSWRNNITERVFRAV